jgi:hypothetical protein
MFFPMKSVIFVGDFPALRMAILRCHHGWLGNPGKWRFSSEIHGKFWKRCIKIVEIYRKRWENLLGMQTLMGK